MGFSCNMCNAVLENFSQLISHYKRVHREDPNFFVICRIDGCGQTYKTFYGYRSHINRRHKAILQVARDIQQPQDLVQNIHMESAEEEAGDVMAGEPLSDEDEVDAPGDQLRSTSAAYLLRIKEMHNLSQTAVDDIVQSTNTLVSTAVKSVCVNIANQLQNIVHEDDDVLQNITWQTLLEQNSQEASPFKDLETENRQRQAYKELFGLVVSNTFINTGRLQNIVHKKIMALICHFMLIMS